jgi:antitoxin-like ribbon-helix-helix protein
MNTAYQNNVYMSIGINELLLTFMQFSSILSLTYCDYLEVKMPRTKTAESAGSSKMFGGRIPDNLIRAMKILAAEENKPVQALLIEALHDILTKYGKKVPRD